MRSTAFDYVDVSITRNRKTENNSRIMCEIPDVRITRVRPGTKICLALPVSTPVRIRLQWFKGDNGTSSAGLPRSSRVGTNPKPN